MNNQNLSTLFKTTLLASAMAMVVGCSDNKVPGVTDTAKTAELTTQLNDTVATAASKGAAITVADGYGTGCTVTSGVEPNIKTAVEVDPDNAPGQYFFATKLTAPIKATGCKDAHTNENLPELQAPAPGESNDAGIDNVNVTPITTLKQKYVDSGLTEAEAKTRTAELLGLDEADLDNDPVKDSSKNTDNGNKLVTAALKLVAVMKTFENAGQADPFKALADATKTKTATTGTLDEAIQDDTVINSVVTDTTKRAEAKTASKAVSDTINTSSNGKSGTELLNAVAKVVKTTLKTTDNNALSDTTTITNNANNETLDEKGIKTSEVTEGSTFFNTVVAKMQEEAKKGNVNFLGDDDATSVKGTIVEINTISGAFAGN